MSSRWSGHADFALAPYFAATEGTATQQSKRSRAAAALPLVYPISRDDQGNGVGGDSSASRSVWRIPQSLRTAFTRQVYRGRSTIGMTVAGASGGRDVGVTSA